MASNPFDDDFVDVDLDDITTGGAHAAARATGLAQPQKHTQAAARSAPPSVARPLVGTAASAAPSKSAIPSGRGGRGAPPQPTPSSGRAQGPHSAAAVATRALVSDRSCTAPAPFTKSAGSGSTPAGMSTSTTVSASTKPAVGQHLNDEMVAQYLVKRQFMLTALEFYQESLEQQQHQTPGGGHLQYLRECFELQAAQWSHQAFPEQQHDNDDSKAPTALMHFKRRTRRKLT